MTDQCNVLMVYPRFNANSFWNCAKTCEVVGAQYPAAPLGLITVAAMLPESWTVKLVDRNAETLDEADFGWADLVMIGGMFPQQWDALRCIDLAHAHGKPVCIGGPGITSLPHIYGAADFKVIGECEGLLYRFIDDWRAGKRSGTYEGVKFKADVTLAARPRWDLLKLQNYLYVCVQFSRGCPFTCEFCDIIELYGRAPRTKTAPQMLAELDALYARGHRGNVDFVDDNLIGNKKAIKAFLPHLIDWQKRHNFPFLLSTEASINLADDHELLGLMRDANFHAVFIGIESPDPDTLVGMRKKQNTRRDLVSSIRSIYNAGILVMGGFMEDRLRHRAPAPGGARLGPVVCRTLRALRPVRALRGGPHRRGDRQDRLRRLGDPASGFGAARPGGRAGRLRPGRAIADTEHPADLRDGETVDRRSRKTFFERHSAICPKWCAVHLSPAWPGKRRISPIDRRPQQLQLECQSPRGWWRQSEAAIRAATA